MGEMKMASEMRLSMEQDDLEGRVARRVMECVKGMGELESDFLTAMADDNEFLPRLLCMWKDYVGFKSRLNLEKKNEDDPDLLKKARALVVARKKATRLFLQCELCIGGSKADELLATLEKQGAIGAEKLDGSHSILVRE